MSEQAVPSVPVPGPAPTSPWWALAVWATVGALGGVGLMALLTIGAFLLGGAAVLALAALAVEPLRSRACAVVVTGAAAGPWYVAWLNRDGPGTVCLRTATAVSCIDEWSPWPFVVAGAILVGVGIGAFRALRRRPGRRRPGRGT
ncbi:hypothetical protein Q6346_00500 [Isoptericola sp. b490]|uniref:hypothetical protein n=1 Tax=Actinotalea lenta TaxID=3064654 RepID=UPI0027132210|nr:hypothetical protein [Isoptericola sp. b490]MDO8119788.1 hypothetical protein [Isoptericola sp. b490]